jgi:hypothetical protein
LLLTIVGAALAAACDAPSDDALCAEARDHVVACLGPVAPAEPLACDPDTSERILATSCEDLVSAAGKDDGVFDDFLCGVGFKCRCAPQTDVPDDLLLDDDADGVGCGGPCRSAPNGGYEDGGYTYAPSHHGAHGNYRIPVETAGTFRLQAFMPVREGAGTADYAINTCSGFTPFEIQQRTDSPEWIDLGVHDLEPGAELRVGGGGGSVFLMDAVRVTRQ